MDLLLDRGLIYGNLFRVDTEALAERYARALRHLTGRETALREFHIDLSGYSPEVGAELGDPAYLNPRGVNRQFILLSVRQQSAPLLEARFSTSRSILRRFIAANEEQLFALTARDAVAGELVNSVFEVETPARLLEIRHVTVEADTTRGVLRAAEALGRLSDRFLREPGAWHDQRLIDEMIATARQSGDVSRSPVRLTSERFEQKTFWTAHFGGAYLFRDVREPAILAAEPERFAGLPLPVIALSDRAGVARFLNANGLSEPVLHARGIDGAAVLRQKMDFITVDTAQHSGLDLEGATRRDLRRIARLHADVLPPEYHALRRMVEGATGLPDPGAPGYFYALRAASGPDEDLVNMLLAEMTPKDVRQLFICHKTLFYRLWQGWSAPKQAYVADFLAREYAVDTAGARAALFGHEPAMAEPQHPQSGPWGPSKGLSARDEVRGLHRKPAAGDDLVARVGPWGVLHRKDRR
ncbi:hypothetical protein KM176_10000 [Pseudooceanicola sp. CBS1P-1]|uniref:Uncharacterized protein n=1 Tax=Pseudooceanicola albus TaxID=2692189 RepID=A0A6L7G8Q6_9RHOB|nr:hypothetical protein [Pseudooceanicola endophyticus]MXN19710.1 hypothetical protein [Pseudooceanicola albus]